MTEPEKSKFLASLPPAELVRALKLAKWVLDGEEDHGLELAYQDGDVIAFRFKGIALRDLDANVGKLLLVLDFVGTSCSPALQVVLPSDTVPEECAVALSKEIEAALMKHLPATRSPWGSASASSSVPK